MFFCFRCCSRTCYIKKTVQQDISRIWTDPGTKIKISNCNSLVYTLELPMIGPFFLKNVGGTVASWLVYSSPDGVVRVRALAGDIVLCSWTRHFTLTVSLSTQEYKWVPGNCWGKSNKLLRSDLQWTSILFRGSRNTPSHFISYGNRDKPRPNEPVGSKRLHFSRIG